MYVTLATVSILFLLAHFSLKVYQFSEIQIGICVHL